VKTFWEVTEKFRGPMWVKNSENKWHNTYWDVIEEIK
jgi:hypothetical protein